MTRERHEVSESLDADERLLPFLPTLLQDLWALGFDPDPTVDMLRRMGLADRPHASMLDLGCGKGCLLIRLVEEFGWRGEGVDLVPEFIEEARRRAIEAEVSGRVRFEVQGIADALQETDPVDLVLFGFDADVLGPLDDALGRIRPRVNEGGHLVLDTVWTRSRESQPELALTEVETREAIGRAGWVVTHDLILEAGWVRAQNRTNTERIRGRAAELADRHPDKRTWFDEYVRRQEEESRLLEEELVCGILVLTPQ